jgi:chromosome segregation ATPase
MRILQTCFIFLVIGILSTQALAEGPAPDAAAKQALAKAQQLLKSLSAERDALKAENAKLQARLEADLGEMKSKLNATQSAASAAAKRAAGESSALNETITAGEARVKELEEKLKIAETKIAGREQALAACTTHNRKLGALSTELLGRYADKGVMDAMMEREPLTQIKRVELENLVQQYDDRIAESQITPEKPVARTN